jgi:biotin carboxyl carrier protein
MKVQADTPGVFWSRPEPKADPFCAEGDVLGPNAQVGLVEVMKMFVPQQTGAAGRFVRYLVEDGALVDAGAELAEIAED